MIHKIVDYLKEK